MKLIVNDKNIDVARYSSFHQQRFQRTLAEVTRLAPASVLEVGGHPWVMTGEILRHGLPLVATVSAEEETTWPDSLDVTSRKYHFDVDGRSHHVPNYSANIERDWIVPTEQVDCVLACEIIEHLIRAPHRLLLNCNRWLVNGGRVLLTTPNGAQFSNPLRTASVSPKFRDAVYKRHNRLFNLAELNDLFEVTGFEVERAEYWQVYPRAGFAKLYDYPGRIPLTYFQQKFCRTLFVVARKVEERSTASRLPLSYAPGDEWDFIDAPTVG